ncbi:hypothetical protein SAMN00017405_2395 [Desulfonispora thiosulfatigenes DSM 11270]|uniref:Uncharacterized protein n=1 Tax=Desulfonispora thiosulfatigenes DSM 11270 TaxID=656914 RepID=A0A1W1VTK9_DESTI|nr:hypothetical protein [Desulfonispora thiosulfatigenes]SMB96697.1 hypothetical protein SAMN00017405_2395 [Desulfonispora thiosulfatigenes DSM 11270]
MLSLNTIFNKRIKWWVVSCLVISLFIGGGLGLYLYEPLSPTEIVTQSMNNTLNANSYSYNAITKSIIDNEENLLTQVKGEKNGDDVHLLGKVFLVNGELEVFRVGDNFYRKDSFSENWLVLENQDIKETEKLMQEINPLGILDFEGDIEVNYLGKENINKSKAKMYKIKANWKNIYLRTSWQDLEYTIWIDSKHKEIIKARISAVNKEHDNNKLILDVVFKNINKEITIKAPID